MPEILANTMLLLVIGTISCVVLGGILVAIRANKFVRRERAKENAMEAELMLEAREVKKGAETASE